MTKEIADTPLIHDRHILLKKFFKSLAGFTVAALFIVSIHSAFEIMYGNGALYHPIWDRELTWLPPVAAQLGLAIILSALAYTASAQFARVAIRSRDLSRTTQIALAGRASTLLSVIRFSQQRKHPQVS